MKERPLEPEFVPAAKRVSKAKAELKGIAAYPGIRGTVKFFETERGTLVSAEVWGLPFGASPCACRVFGFHIHGGTRCGGNGSDPLAGAMSHYNPRNCPHPCHAGDMPPLFGNRGYAFSVFLTDRFTADEVVGRTVIIHASPDDFKTQPSGNSGEKIACGIIEKIGKK